MARVVDLSRLRQPRPQRTRRVHIPTLLAVCWAETLAARSSSYRVLTMPREMLVQMHLMDSRLRRGIVRSPNASRVQSVSDDGGGKM